MGGGSLPGETLPTHLLRLKVTSVDQTLAQMRTAHPPIIARAQEGLILLDPRTVLPEQEGPLLEQLANILKGIELPA